MAPRESGSFPLKPSSSTVAAYYATLQEFEKLGVKHESAVRTAFQDLLRHCASRFALTLVPEYFLKRGDSTVRTDGSLLDEFKLAHGHWEAKDTSDDLEREVRRKFQAGYPRTNIIFQEPKRAILYQNGVLRRDADLTDPTQLVEVLEQFFNYEQEQIDDWRKAVEEFKDEIPHYGQAVLDIIRKEYRESPKFKKMFDSFAWLCRISLNPNLRNEAIEEMLVQHLLTERIFRSVFDNPDFTRRNAIAVEIEKVIDGLTERSFSRPAFLKKLDPFYVAIEKTAKKVDSYSEKQDFLNTVYERFFQGFAVKIADTHGIVYTPQPIVDFMVRSVDSLLRKEFGKSLGDKSVHILDPFVGTGNFILRVLEFLKKRKPTTLQRKYEKELHCNEVMLLPYYIACMNIEHLYFELTGAYHQFKSICLVDTFQTYEPQQVEFTFMNEENTDRVQELRQTPITVIIGNPPYNAGQVNENDNNKNRKYPHLDKSVKNTYGERSKRTLLRKLRDPYVKAFRWATERLNDQGVIAYVSNHSFLDDLSFDGMRAQLADDFDSVYILDLGGNVRKNPKLSGTAHNVFGIQVGVCIAFLVRKGPRSAGSAPGKIYHARVDEYWRKAQKLDFLDEKSTYGEIEWTQVEPDQDHTWLHEDHGDGYSSLLPLGTKAGKAHKGRDVKGVIFHQYTLGVSTNRDSVAYDFSRKTLIARIKEFCQNYNAEVDRYLKAGSPDGIDDFVDYTKLKWSRNLKRHLRNGQKITYSPDLVRPALYRSFVRKELAFQRMIVDEMGSNETLYPTPDVPNITICCTNHTQIPFTVFITEIVPDLAVGGRGGHCFPRFVPDADSKNGRRENISDWSLAQFRERYEDSAITKESIFFYVYGLLHSKEYREKFALNLRRELPRIPFARDFWAFAKAGQTLASLHLNYENAEEYDLHETTTPDMHMDYRAGSIRLSRDKKTVIYNEWLRLDGVPAEALSYKLGNRSALEFVLDQYSYSKDEKTGAVTDPNRDDDPEYIIRLIKRVISVSIDTVRIMKELPSPF